MGIVIPLGKYMETGSSNFTSPCCTISLNRSEVNTFVTDPIWNTESPSSGRLSFFAGRP